MNQQLSGPNLPRGRLYFTPAKVSAPYDTNNIDVFCLLVGQGSRDSMDGIAADESIHMRMARVASTSPRL